MVDWKVEKESKGIAGTNRLYILLILLLAFFLRTYQLDSQALRGDEAATVHYSALPVTELWELARVTDPHPPLYYLMLHPWQWLLGENAWLMRFTGVIASVLAVAALYALARRTLHTVGPSLLAAALLSLNPFQIWLAQDLRSYSFFTLFGLLSSWALWRAISSQQSAVRLIPSASLRASLHPFSFPQGKPSSLQLPSGQALILHPFGCAQGRPSSFTPWLLYILFTVACLYTHYYTLFLIAFQWIFVLLNLKNFWPQKWPWLASQVTIGLLIIPGLLLARNLAGQAAGGIDTISTPDILRLASTALLTGFTIDPARGLWASLLLAPVWIIGLLTLLRRDFTSGTFWGLFFVIPVLAVIALSLNRPFFKERFLIQAQPAFELLLTVGFLSLWQIGQSIRPTPYTSRITSHVSRLTPHASRIIATLLLAALLYFNLFALSNYFTNPAYAKAPPWYLYHDYVSGNARPGDVMLTNFPEAAVSYYSPNELPFYVVPAERDRPVEFRVEQTKQIAGAYQRIWFLPLLRQGFDEQGDVLNWLDRHGDRVNQIFFPIYNVNLYLSPPAIEATLIPQSVNFAHGLNLRGYQILDEDGDSRLSPLPTSNGEKHILVLESGDEFTLSLYWLADGPTPIPYTVFTHLIAADGFNQASQDNQPVWGAYPTTNWQPGEKVIDKYSLTIPEGAPPGDYSLRIGWYQADTLERVPILDDERQPLDDHLILNIIVRVE